MAFSGTYDPWYSASAIRSLGNPFDRPPAGPFDPTGGGARFLATQPTAEDSLHEALEADYGLPEDDNEPQDDTPALFNTALVLQLVAVAAFCKELELQSHVLHLNVSGPSFLSLHAYLKDRYQAHQEQFDSLAELVLTSGSLFPLNSEALRSVLPPFKHLSDPDTTTMCAVYHGNLQSLATLVADLEATAADAKAPDIANYAAELLADARKAAWFIAATAL